VAQRQLRVAELLVQARDVPASFSPCSAKTSLPFAMPSSTSPTGSQLPWSHTITLPAP
jgi:hypothetical protein